MTKRPVQKAIYKIEHMYLGLTIIVNLDARICL